MKVVEYATAAAFLDRASAYLLASSAENNLALGIARGVSSAGGTAFFATVDEGSEILLASVWTPPHRVIVTRASDAATRAFADHLVLRREKPTGVLSSRETCDVFADQWKTRTGDELRTAFEERLYLLTKVKWPKATDGALRRAEAKDLETVTDWTQRFSTDAGLGSITLAEARAAATSRIDNGALYVWDNVGPVSMACLARPSPPTIAVNYVFTPESLRGRGYAKSCVAALSQHALDDGYTQCVLYADLANPVSNRVYTDIGYEAVADFRLIDFTPTS